MAWWLVVKTRALPLPRTTYPFQRLPSNAALTPALASTTYVTDAALPEAEFAIQRQCGSAPCAVPMASIQSPPLFFQAQPEVRSTNKCVGPTPA